MLGKRPRQMRRTVSVSMMGPESMPPELPIDKHKPHVFPAPQSSALHFHEASAAAQPGMAQSGNILYSGASPVIPVSMELNLSGPRPWQKIEAGAVGLSIVAALHGTEAQTFSSMKDGYSQVVVTHKPVNQSSLLPLANLFAYKMQQQRYSLTEPQTPGSSNHRQGSGSSMRNGNAGMHFLEACCFCRKKLSQGRDIYMYRGDKAFCSEECRHQQILIDDRKCSLTALKMRTAPQSVLSSGQRRRGMVTSTAAG